MRYSYLLLLVLWAQVVCGQTAADTLLTDAQPPQELMRRVVSRTDSTGRCAETLSWGGADGLVRVYYASGLLKEYVPYADLGTDQVHGLVTTWYENGQLESRQPFQQGKRDGKLELYYASGQLKRDTDYVAGAELPGRCFNAQGQVVPYFLYEQLPLYPGGNTQLAKEINKAMRWPREVPSTFLSFDPRTVYISFWVDKSGRICQPQVAVSSQLPSLDHAVLATVQKLTRRFTPAMRDGLVVESKYCIPVQFERVIYSGRATRN